MYLSSDAVEEEKKSNIMYFTDYGRTCLHQTCCKDAPDDIMKTIIDIGGNELVMMIDKSDRTALHDACFNGASYNIIRKLIEVGGKDLVMAKNDNGITLFKKVGKEEKREKGKFGKFKYPYLPFLVLWRPNCRPGGNF